MPRFTKEMKDHPEYKGKSQDEKNAFKRRWAHGLWDAAEKQQSRVKTTGVSGLAGNEARFISEVKLIEYLGKNGAENYINSVWDLEPQSEWRKYCPLSKLWFFNFVEQFSRVAKHNSFEIKDTDTIVDEAPGGSLELMARSLVLQWSPCRGRRGLAWH